MKKLLIGALLAAQLQVAAAPAFAQSYSPVRETETGAFGGLRLRIPFGGAAREPVRAGLAFAPTTRADHQDGRVRTRIGEGLEFGLRGRDPVSFSIAGRSLRQLNAQGDNDRGGVPTGLWVAGGLVLLTVVVVGVGYLVLDSAND